MVKKNMKLTAFLKTDEYAPRKANGVSNIKSNGKATKNPLGNLPRTSSMPKMSFSTIGLANTKTTPMIISPVLF